MGDEYRLITWISQFPKTFISDKLITTRTDTTGNSIFAGSQIFKNERIISIPPLLNLNFVTVLQHLQKYTQHSEVPIEIDDPCSRLYMQLTMAELKSLSSFQLISFYLVLESKRLESFWSPFIEVLPQLSEFNSIPFTWAVEGESKHFAKLPMSVKNHSLKQLNNFKNDFKVVQELLNTKDTNIVISETEFLRFWNCCNSRCLYMKLPKDLQKSEEDNFTMVPLVDFLNHDIENGCQVSVTREGFQVFSGTTYNRGDQVYLSYGAHSNEFLLCEYGFMLDQRNKWNSIDITPQILNLLGKFPEKVKFLSENGYLGDYYINTEVSFRIEVALLVLQEEDGFAAISPPKRLTNFMQGLTSGECYQNKTSEILKEILIKLLDDCQLHLETTSSDYKDVIIQKLYQDIQEIALNHLNSFI